MTKRRLDEARKAADEADVQLRTAQVTERKAATPAGALLAIAGAKAVSQIPALEQAYAVIELELMRRELPALVPELIERRRQWVEADQDVVRALAAFEAAQIALETAEEVRRQARAAVDQAERPLLDRIATLEERMPELYRPVNPPCVDLHVGQDRGEQYSCSCGTLFRLPSAGPGLSVYVRIVRETATSARTAPRRQEALACVDCATHVAPTTPRDIYDLIARTRNERSVVR